MAICSINEKIYFGIASVGGGDAIQARAPNFSRKEIVRRLCYLPSSHLLAVHGLATPPHSIPMSLQLPEYSSSEPPKTPYDFDPTKWDSHQSMAENGGSEGTPHLVPCHSASAHRYPP